MKDQVRILCVDDEKNVLNAMERIFIDEEYEILTATSGKEGLNMLGRVSPVHVVISDYRMPEMNGVDFLRQVYDKWPDTVRIVLSGYADTASVIAAINEGRIYKFICKPWNDDELKVTIANAVERYFLRKKNVELVRELIDKTTEMQKLHTALERHISERSSELMMQNRTFAISQNVIQSLPVGIICIGSDGIVLQCNDKGREMLKSDGSGMVGKHRADVLSKEINGFVGMVIDHKLQEEAFLIAGRRIRTKGAHVRYSEEETGVVLVLDEDRAA